MDAYQKQNPEELKRKILNILKMKGPSLPIQIARETNINSLFAGAFLSELAKEDMLKISHLKVGGSPLYYLHEQKVSLEKFYSYLPDKEKQGFTLLKQKKILNDSKLEPSIRVALRNLKDFAVPFIQKSESGQQLYWRFYSTPLEEITSKVQNRKEKIKKTPESKEKPLLDIKPEKEKSKKSGEKPEFAKKINSLLVSGNIEILEELEAKKREFSAIIRINSDLGKFKVLCIAKDKKSVTENDLNLAYQKSQSLKMPVLFLSPGNPNKKALSVLENYANLVKFKQIL